MIDSLPTHQKTAVRLAALLIGAYNSKDGTGMFSGPERYAVLSQRMPIAAAQSSSILSFVGRCQKLMRWPSMRQEKDKALEAFISCADQHLVLDSIANEGTAIVSIARLIAKQEKPTRDLFDAQSPDGFEDNFEEKTL